VGATTFHGSPINTSTLRTEIFAVGFRHIWRFSNDQPTGDIWVGEVGQDWCEENNIVTNGGNYGWAYHDAYTNSVALHPNQPTLLSNPPPQYIHSPPLYVYLHVARPGGDPQFKGNSVTGGVVYRGSRIPELHGAYIFGDFESGHVWALRRTNGSVNVQRLAGQLGVAAFGHDPSNGDVLIANYVFNQVQRIVRTDAVGASFPQKLSDTGAFADVPTLTPNPGIVNYEPIVPFWSDHAIKRRWFALPDLTSTFTHVADSNWNLPNGMVWVKHFDLELERGNPAVKQRLETRFIVKNDAGIYGVSYAWNAAGDEAYLVPDAGTNFPVVLTENSLTITQQWAIPSRTECLACHTEVAGHALSFNTRQLNQTATMNGWTDNQLATLSAAGYFTTPVPAPQTLPAFVAANDASASLEQRVRSYLSVNCVQCHQAGGGGSPTWDARAWLSLDETKLINGALNDDGNDPANRLVVPGDLAHSVLLQRVRGNGFSRMPPLATAVIDQVATNLLTAWISS
jgi:mono/diheme cytochrome c family protein